MMKPERRPTRRYVLYIVLGAVLLALIVVLVWASSYVPVTTARASEAWSRGRTIGLTAVSRPSAIRPAPDGGVYVAWPNPDSRIEMTRIATDGTVEWDLVLPVGNGAANNPALQVGEDGRLHLLWWEGGGTHPTIEYVLLEPDGSAADTPRTLAELAGWLADPPRLALLPDGRPCAVWADMAGIYWLALSSEGGPAGEPSLLAAGGRAPAVQVDSLGLLHLTWRAQTTANITSILYAALDPQNGELSAPEEVAWFFQRVGQVIEGPTIALDTESGYIIWSVHDWRDGSVQTQYAFFPLNLPRQERVIPLTLEEGSHPSAVFPLDGQQSSALAALSAQVGSGRDAEFQIALVTLEQRPMPEHEVWGMLFPTTRQGQGLLSVAPRPDPARWLLLPNSAEWEEQIVSASPSPSVKPALAEDGRSELHLTWLEPAGNSQYRVIYASTAPEVQANYNTSTVWDVVYPTLNRLAQLSLVAVAFGPAIVVWAMMPMGGLLLYHMATGEEWLVTVRSRLAVGTALLVEVVLSALIPVSSAARWMPQPWMEAVATAVPAALLTWLFVRRRCEQDVSLFAPFLLFTCFHVVLQLLVQYLILL